MGSLGALVLIRQFNSREQVSSMTLHNWYHSDNSPNYVQFNVLYNYRTTNNNGNLLSVTANNSPGTLASPSLSLSPTITTSYTYNGLGQRVQKQISGGATYDALGSVRFVTNGTAVIIAHHDYLPYGEEVKSGAAGRTGGNFGVSTNVNQMFTGQERDGGTAMLDYFNARHYSAYAGGFMQPDPGNAGADFVRPQSWNAYAYVLGNPLGLVDPSGMIGKDPSGIDGGDCFEAGNPDPYYYSVGDGGIYGSLGGSNSGASSTAPEPPSPAQSSVPSSAVPYSCDFYGCWSISPVNWSPTVGPCVFAPSGNYNVKGGVNLRFESSTSSHLSSAISVMNSQGVTPTVTDGFRTAIDQAVRIGDPLSITPAKINQSLHQSRSAVDLRIDENSSVVNRSMTGAGFTWGGRFSKPDPVHYQMGAPGSKPDPSLAKACGGWQF